MNTVEENVYELRKMINTPQSKTPTVAYRGTAGQALKSLISGDEHNIGKYLYNRSIEAIEKREAQTVSEDFTGSVMADDPLMDVPVFMKDLTHTVEKASPLAAVFKKAALPSEGMSLSYLVNKTNTITAEKQEKEGDKLPTGKIELETKTATIDTYGGLQVKY